MSKPKKTNSSWKNYVDYYKHRMTGKGKPTKLENAVLQHPDESSNSIYNYLQSKKKRNLWTVNFEQFQKLGLNESNDWWDFDWDSALRGEGEGNDNKWNSLEKDVKGIVDKYQNDFGVDSYGIIDAIHQVVDGMVQRVDKGE
jgi:predicted transcriptional regulator